MKKTTIILIGVMILSKILGLGRDVILSYYYGATNISDAYLISITIPSVIFGFIGIGISTGYIPMYSKLEKEFGLDTANKYTSNLINMLMVLCTIVLLLGFVFAEQIVRVFASGFDSNTLEIAVLFTRISLIGIYATSLLYIFKSFLEMKSIFILPALLGFPLNIITISSIVISAKSNIMILSVGSLIATISQVLLLLPLIKKNGYRHSFKLNLKDKYIIKMVSISIPLILGLSVNQFNALIDRTIASQLAVGAISALNYGNMLINFIQGVFVLSISSVMYPSISKMAADDNLIGLKKSISEAIVAISLLVTPATIGAIIFSEQLISLLFGRGAFSIEAIKMTSSVLSSYSVGMVAFGYREILSRTFYAFQDTKTPMINACISMILNIVLNVILSKFLGVGGLALATSISATFCTILLFVSLRKKIGPFGMKNIITSFMKIISAALIMGIISSFVFSSLLGIYSQNIALIISILIAIIVYFIVLYFMKIDEIDSLIKVIMKKFKS